MIVSLPHVALPPTRLPFDRLATESVVHKRRPAGVELSHRSQLGRMNACHSAGTTTADPWLLKAPTHSGLVAPYGRLCHIARARRLTEGSGGRISLQCWAFRDPRKIGNDVFAIVFYS